MQYVFTFCTKALGQGFWAEIILFIGKELGHLEVRGKLGLQVPFPFNLLLSLALLLLNDNHLLLEGCLLGRKEELQIRN